MSQHQKPCLELRSFPLKAAVWENAGKDGRKWFSVKLTKSYKDDEGKWQESASLTDRDLLAAAALLLEVWRTVAIKDPSEKASEDRPF